MVKEDAEVTCSLKGAPDKGKGNLIKIKLVYIYLKRNNNFYMLILNV